LKEGAGNFVGALFALCCEVGVVDLAEDLVFADDLAVEGCGDAKEVADGFSVAVGVEGILEVGAGKLVPVGEEVGDGLVHVLYACLGTGIDFYAVAGIEDDGPAVGELLFKLVEGETELVRFEGEFLACFEGARMVADSCDGDCHEVTPKKL
jgi:hypothetical protein